MCTAVAVSLQHMCANSTVKTMRPLKYRSRRLPQILRFTLQLLDLCCKQLFSMTLQRNK